MINRQLFNLGATNGTPDALRAIEKHGHDPDSYIQRHQSGDWGVIGTYEEIREALHNARAVNRSAQHNFAGISGSRSTILSEFLLPDRTRIWIITAWDKSMTTIMLPGEYLSQAIERISTALQPAL